MITTSAFSVSGLMRQMLGVSLAVAFLLTSPTLAVSIRVEQDGSGDFLEIQAAIDISASGDTILIGPGNYNQAHSIYIEPWGTSTDVFVDLSGKDLTLIGSDSNEVLVGPDFYYSTFLGPIGFFRIDSTGSWSVKNITFRNCYGGVYGAGELELVNCIFKGQVGGGVQFFAGSGVIKNCSFEGNDLGLHFSGSANLRVDHSTFVDSECYLANVQNVQVLDSTFEGTSLKLFGSGGSIYRTEGVDSQIYVRGSVDVDIRNCNFLMRNYASLVVSGSVVSVDSCIFSSNIFVVAATDGGALVAHNSHILPAPGGTGDLVRVVDYPFSGDGIDMRNNFWGTNDAEVIAAGIWDGNDDPTLNVVVEFEPFISGPVPTGPVNLGDVKSMFR